MEFSFVVSGHPVPKARARVVAKNAAGETRSHSFTPPKTKNYEATVRLVASSARPSGWPTRARYEVTLRALRASARGDLDNICKAVKDACNGVAWVDDARVYKLDAEMFDGAERPRVEVRVVARPIRCKLRRCGYRETLFPDEQGRCEPCAAKAAARKA